jgi:hypothetical protein
MIVSLMYAARVGEVRLEREWSFYPFQAPAKVCLSNRAADMQ